MLLFDQNISPRLVERLKGEFPGSTHVSFEGLGAASDPDVWDFALQKGYVIVTKDADFSDLSMLRGHPPKVLWLRIGNCTTNPIEGVLRLHQEAILEFYADSSMAVLVLHRH